MPAPTFLSTDLTATNLRAVATKRFGLASLAAGVGWDHYTGHAQVQFRDPVTAIPEQVIELELASSRTMGFVNAGIGFRHAKLVGEAGYQLGKDHTSSLRSANLIQREAGLRSGGTTVGL